jgi:hypothetical protein
MPGNFGFGPFDTFLEFMNLQALELLPVHGFVSDIPIRFLIHEFSRSYAEIVGYNVLSLKLRAGHEKPCV